MTTPVYWLDGMRGLGRTTKRMCEQTIRRVDEQPNKGERGGFFGRSPLPILQHEPPSPKLASRIVAIPVRAEPTETPLEVRGAAQEV